MPNYAKRVYSTVLYNHTSIYTVKTGLFSVSFPQTVSLQITDVLNKYLGKHCLFIDTIVFGLWHKHHFSVLEGKLFWFISFECSNTPAVYCGNKRWTSHNRFVVGWNGCTNCVGLTFSNALILPQYNADNVLWLQLMAGSWYPCCMWSSIVMYSSGLMGRGGSSGTGGCKFESILILILSLKKTPN